MLLLGELAEQVRQASREGMDLDEIDAEIIEPAEVSEVVKGVLWMMAFAAVSPARQYEVVHEHLVIVGEQIAALN